MFCLLTCRRKYTIAQTPWQNQITHVHTHTCSHMSMHIHFLHTCTLTQARGSLKKSVGWCLLTAHSTPKSRPPFHFTVAESSIFLLFRARSTVRITFATQSSMCRPLYIHTMETKNVAKLYISDVLRFFYYIPLKIACQRSIKLAHDIKRSQPQLEKHQLNATVFFPKDETNQDLVLGFQCFQSHDLFEDKGTFCYPGTTCSEGWVNSFSWFTTDHAK